MSPTARYIPLDLVDAMASSKLLIDGKPSGRREIPFLIPLVFHPREWERLLVALTTN